MSLAPRTWAAVPAAVAGRLGLFKVAASPPPLPDLWGWKAAVDSAYWGGPTPLANLIVGTALGAAGGHLAGVAADAVSPEDPRSEPGSRRRFLRNLGGVLGAVPGAYTAYDNYRMGVGLDAAWPPPAPVVPLAAGLGGPAAAAFVEPQFAHPKAAAWVAADPTLTAPHKALVGGWLAAAAALAGRDELSALDLSRPGGATKAASVAAAKTAAALFALPDDDRRALQSAGWWGGVLRAVVPSVYDLDG